MKNRKTLIILSVVVLIGIVVFFICKKNCGKSSTSNEKKRIGFVVPTLENPFFVDMTNGAKDKALSMQNVEVIVQAPQKVEDDLAQNQMVENLITQKVDAICIVPTNSETIIPAILKANAANIPIINIDNKVDMEKAAKQNAKIAAYIGSDNFDGGKLAGQYIMEKLGNKGKVAILEGVSGNDAAIKRKAGFLEAIKNSPDIKVVSSQVANWNRDQAFTIFQAVLTANPDLNAVFACNDEMALGAASAIEQNKTHKQKITVVGFDAIKDAKDAINTGKMDATIAQQPALMGEKGLQLALDILAKKTVETVYSTELKIIKK